MRSAPTKAALGPLLPFLPAAALLLLGWWAIWFLCDDAFIAFRYVGNAYDGRGLVWNAAPFAPVEGYSCFLWVAVLYVVWLWTGVPPPVAANPLALACALATLWLVARRLAVPGGRLVATLALLGVAGNHTFATWSSSGLETAMFGLWAVGWTLAATGPAPARGAEFGRLAAFAALAQLTRPDGGLLVLATLAIGLQRAFVGGLRVRGLFGGLSPLLLPVAHLLWRRGFYGEWLPNTYHAKIVAAWPESGLRYLYCFALEHGILLLLPLLLLGLWGAMRRTTGGFAAALRAVCGERFAAAAAVATWLLFVGYYTLVVGGDHFAYRPFAHLLPLLAVAAVAALRALAWPKGWSLVALVVLAIAGNTFGWCYERALRGREKDGFVPASAVLPAPLAGCFVGWDRCQAWLRLRYVALPRPLHAATCRDLLQLLPERRPGLVQGLSPGARGVYRTVAAGVVGWALADVAIVDAVGLNDWVVARHRGEPPGAPFDLLAQGDLFPRCDTDGSGRLEAREIASAAAQWPLSAATGVVVSAATWADLLLAICDRDDDGLDPDEFAGALAEIGNRRHMAHERTPPPGYIEALRPNVELRDGRFVAVAGVPPLTDDEVMAVEAKFRALVGRR
jgi:arabinofuranosyltransferase